MEGTLLPILSNDFEVLGEKLKGSPQPSTCILFPRDSSSESYQKLLHFYPSWWPHRDIFGAGPLRVSAHVTGQGTDGNAGLWGHADEDPAAPYIPSVWVPWGTLNFTPGSKELPVTICRQKHGDRLGVGHLRKTTDSRVVSGRLSPPSLLLSLHCDHL